MVDPRLLIRAGLVLCLLGSSGLWRVAHAQEEAPFDCTNPEAQQALNYCAGQDYAEADDVLNSVYKKAMQWARDEDKAVKEYSPELVGAVDALKKAQRAWIDYRDGHCDATGFHARGGSMEPQLVANCLKEMTQKRTGELRALMKGLGN
jgi:uncharacterized protein YecT (DUF1311 family)